MPRPSATEYSASHQTYINYTSGKEYSILVQQYQDRIIESWNAIPLEKINFAYAPDKWTIKQMLQHVIDTERIFAYRALSIARKEPATRISPRYPEIIKPWSIPSGWTRLSKTMG